MATTLVESAEDRPARLRRERVEPALGLALLAGLGVWLVVNLLHAPTQFANVALAGLRTGAIYALIALGYHDNFIGCKGFIHIFENNAPQSLFTWVCGLHSFKCFWQCNPLSINFTNFSNYAKNHR